MSFIATLLDAFTAATRLCIPNSNISINGRAYRIIKLLGEGGFSFVYLAQDGSGQLYALKKIRCAMGTAEETLAQREIEMYQLFSHKNIIRLMDSATITESDGSKTIYIFLPYYKKGNLQDAISRHQLHSTYFSEEQALGLFREVCTAVQVFHTYTAQGATRSDYEATPHHHLDEHAQQARALLGEQGHLETADSGQDLGTKGERMPWAHRDIKPGNILLSDDGTTPILMDFGSACKARIPINTRQEALAQQDVAAEHCSMPYRAPELFDVKTDSLLDEKVDIWSLGCTLYAMAYGQSPFEMNMNELGGSVALAVLNGQFKFPTDAVYQNQYSQAFKDLIIWILNTDPKLRPTIHEVFK
ncbi:kinase-like domain-containing protein [Spinellus fusiger]|nr:kinase-like domain-containing protein [Spinellus fusiger]